MLKTLLFSIGFLVATTTGQPVFSQSDRPTDETTANEDSAVDAAEAQLRELICSRAADFSHPRQEFAVDFVIRRDYHDDRFGPPIRQVLKNAAETDRWDAERIQQAMKLLPFSNLDPKQQTELVFKCYLKSGNTDLRQRTRADLHLSQVLRKYLARYPNATSNLVKEKMVKDGVEIRLLQLARIHGESSEGLLPMLLEAAKSDDYRLAEDAMNCADDLIRQMRRRALGQRMVAQAKPAEMAGVDKKMIQYAERIIGRYDANKDQTLSKVEYKKMLLSPADADTDQDGSITIIEYATWMQNRAKPSK